MSTGLRSQRPPRPPRRGPECVAGPPALPQRAGRPFAPQTRPAGLVKPASCRWRTWEARREAGSCRLLGAGARAHAAGSLAWRGRQRGLGEVEFGLWARPLLLRLLGALSLAYPHWLRSARVPQGASRVPADPRPHGWPPFLPTLRLARSRVMFACSLQPGVEAVPSLRKPGVLIAAVARLEAVAESSGSWEGGKSQCAPRAPGRAPKSWGWVQPSGRATQRGSASSHETVDFA